MSLVVELEKGGRVRMLLLQMDVMDLRLLRSKAAVLTDINLVKQIFTTLVLKSVLVPITFDLLCLYSY